MNDIFKDMQAKVGCDYLSDLPSYKRKVWHEMKRLNLADYEERQLEDFSKYVFGMSYQTIKDVMKWCCIIKVDTLFSRILIYNHNQYENRRKTYGTESKIL